jgi:integrase
MSLGSGGATSPKSASKACALREGVAGAATFFDRACKKAGLQGLWFHDLRRSSVTNARRRGVPESVVMKMSGHKTRAVFDRYNIIDEEDLRAAVKRIEAGISRDLGHDLDTRAKGEPRKVESPTS